MRVYLSGPITGKDNYKEDFKKAEKYMKDKGYDVINPSVIEIECLSWQEYMEIDLKLLDMCDMIYMIPGWEGSRGATIEHDYAIKKGKLLYKEEFKHGSSDFNSYINHSGANCGIYHTCGGMCGSGE